MCLESEAVTSYVRPLTLPVDTVTADVKGFDQNFPWQEKRKEL